MKNTKSIILPLSLATSSLLGTNNSIAAESDKNVDIGKWDIKTAVLFYSEEDDRVMAIEPVISATKITDNGDTVSLKVAIDSLTGASPSGAVASSSPQTFTSPSGNASYTTEANQAPLDSTFLDTRVAISGNWAKALENQSTLTLGGVLSKEYDYLSFSINALYAKDVNNRNTTLSTGLSLAHDTIDAVGGIPTAFGRMQTAGQTQPREGSNDSKNITDILIGITQVLTPNSLLALNYSYSNADGYLTDPYKVLSVVDSVSGEPIEIVFENRPNTRNMHSLYGQYKHYLNGDILDASLRLLTDDWGIASTTLDLTYRWRTSENTYWKPHLRYYTQSAADFYQPFLNGSAPIAGTRNDFATADYRLGNFDAITLGIEYGHDNIKQAWAVSIEYYSQSVNEPDNKFGQLINQELSPDLNALMLRLTFDY